MIAPSAESQLYKEEVNQYLHQWHDGDEEAFNKVMELLYQDLHTIASRLFGYERMNHTLQADDLVNQLYLKLFKYPNRQWTEYNHFLNAAARTMRQILIDHSRSWNRRPGGRAKICLEDAPLLQSINNTTSDQIVAIDQVVCRLEEIDSQTARIADLKLILGLTLEEISHTLNLEINKVKREWIFIKRVMKDSLLASAC